MFENYQHTDDSKNVMVKTNQFSVLRIWRLQFELGSVQLSLKYHKTVEL